MEIKRLCQIRIPLQAGRLDVSSYGVVILCPGPVIFLYFLAWIKGLGGLTGGVVTVSVEHWLNGLSH